MDNQSTVNILCDCTLVKTIRPVSGCMNIHCNAGIASNNWVGYLEVFGTVWYHKEGIENIIYLAKVQAKYHITCNSQNTNAFLLFNKDGQVQLFRMSDWGIYYLKMTVESGANLNTVAAKRFKYSARDYSRGLNAR